MFYSIFRSRGGNFYPDVTLPLDGAVHHHFHPPPPSSNPPTPTTHPQAPSEVIYLPPTKELSHLESLEPRGFTFRYFGGSLNGRLQIYASVYVSVNLKEATHKGKEEEGPRFKSRSDRLPLSVAAIFKAAQVAPAPSHYLDFKSYFVIKQKLIEL